MYALFAETPQNKDIDKGVLNSLISLNQQFGLKPFNSDGLHYPYNVLLAHEHAEKQLRRKCRNMELFIMEKDNEGYALATMQTASRSCDLYYIPVRSLYRLMRSGKSKLAENLLLAVFSYLYHVARVPGHRDEETFLYYHTDMIKDWIEDENGWDDEDNSVLKADLKRAEYEGDYVQKRIWHPYHLEHFAETVANAKPKNPIEKSCLNLAGKYLELWQEHPEGNIFKNLLLSDGRTGEEDDDNYDYGNTIYVHEYIHFVHDLHDTLYDNMHSNIQTEFNEKPYAQEHSVINFYGYSSDNNKEGLNYETRFFELADELCDILINEI